MPTVYDGPLPYDAPFPYENPHTATLAIKATAVKVSKAKNTHDAIVDI